MTALWRELRVKRVLKAVKCALTARDESVNVSERSGHQGKATYRSARSHWMS